MTALDASAAPRTLRFDVPVACAEVHKRAIEEVFITDSTMLGPDTFACAAQLPRSHRTYVPSGARHHDLLLLLEVVRQATIVVAHRHLGVPRRRQFLMGELQLAIEDLSACAHRREPAAALIELDLAEMRHLDSVLAKFELHGRVIIDGVRAASGMGTCLCLSAEDYAAVRGATRSATSVELPQWSAQREADPGEVGRQEAEEVVIAKIARLGPEVVRGEVVVDPAHPSFFDHSLDHVPATLLVEAGRQMAHAAAQPFEAKVATRCHVRFDAFAELGVPLVGHAHAANDGSPGSARVRVELAQQDTPVAHMNFDLRSRNE